MLMDNSKRAGNCHIKTDALGCRNVYGGFVPSLLSGSGEKVVLFSTIMTEFLWLLLLLLLGLSVCDFSERAQRSPCRLQDCEQPHLNRSTDHRHGSDGRNRTLRWMFDPLLHHCGFRH